MSITKDVIVPDWDEYEFHRQQFTLEQLAPYRDQWVAFSCDGRRIVAAAAGLLELDQRVEQAGENPENVGLEFIGGEDCCLGGADLNA